MAEHKVKIKEYESECTSYKLRRQDFLDAYSEWREDYIKHLREEEGIEEKLEEDRTREIRKIYDTQYVPAKDKLDACNDLITEEYLPVLDFIIDLIKSKRADDLKEAINLYEEIVYRERQLKLQREKEEQRRREEEIRRADEERRHREDMKLREDQERQRRYDEEQRQRKEDERQARENKEREIREKQAARDAMMEAQRKCHWCKNWTSCGLRRNPPLNCTGFRPGSTHQI